MKLLSDTITAAQIIKLLSDTITAALLFQPPLMPQYHHQQHPILEHRRPTFLPQRERPEFIPVKQQAKL
jgi:hypothetical protein